MFIAIPAAGEAQAASVCETCNLVVKEMFIFYIM